MYCTKLYSFILYHYTALQYTVPLKCTALFCKPLYQARECSLIPLCLLTFQLLQKTLIYEAFVICLVLILFVPLPKIWSVLLVQHPLPHNFLWSVLSLLLLKHYFIYKIAIEDHNTGIIIPTICRILGGRRPSGI